MTIKEPFSGRAPPWAQPLAVGVVATALGVLAFVYYAGAVIHRWYVGAFLMDFGWFNYLVSGRSLLLDDPSAMDGWSYFSVHVAPLLLLFGQVSKLFGLSGAQPMALMLGLAFGGAAAMAVVVIERFLRPAGAVVALAGAAAAAAVYALSGLPRAIVDYPHMEILYVPFALLTLHLLFQRRFRWAWAALVPCLAAREDSGLHLACILGAYLVLAAIDERGAPHRLREIAPYLGACILYPLAAILWQRMTWPGSSTFAAIYAGDPPYRHLTAALLAHRAALFAGARAWVTLTLAAALSVLPFQLRWTALTGVVAATPWFLLNVTAHSTAAGEFLVYYAFPFLVTALAPFIVGAAAPAPPREEDRLALVPL